MTDCPTCRGVGEIPDGDLLPRAGGFPHPNQGFVECWACDGRGVAA